MEKTKLNKILAGHEKWLNGEGRKRAYLLGANLCDADLCGANLCNANLCDADLRGAYLRNAKLRDVNIRGANLQLADLRGADIRLADLRDADLRGAYIDYSAWPLWCGSLRVKIDARIAAQLVYHAVRACQSVTDDDGVMAFCRAPEVVALANRFNRANECGLVGIDNESEVK